MHLGEQSLTKEAVIRKTKERRALVITGWRTKKNKSQTTDWEVMRSVQNTLAIKYGKICTCDILYFCAEHSEYHIFLYQK